MAHLRCRFRMHCMEQREEHEEVIGEEGGAEEKVGGVVGKWMSSLVVEGRQATADRLASRLNVPREASGNRQAPPAAAVVLSVEVKEGKDEGGGDVTVVGCEEEQQQAIVISDITNIQQSEDLLAIGGDDDLVLRLSPADISPPPAVEEVDYGDEVLLEETFERDDMREGGEAMQEEMLPPELADLGDVLYEK
eukprot:GHVS01030269.1.p1 GENE.GHVS01030269.1~~GHVS01030269.1.p1  ORF type:complete len:193 (-),score=66.59 GHVS01030269.1:89-667(-)